MAGNISGLHPFANDVGPVPLKLLDDSFTTLSIALNTLSTFSNFYSDTGTTNAYTINTTQYQFASYTDGLRVTVRLANTNTGASTLNVNGLGAMPILTGIGTEVQPGSLLAGSLVTFIYNAARQAWQIEGSAGGGVMTAPFSVTNSDGQNALAINQDGSGYLGDFNGNGLSWDAACHFTFEGGATLAGIQPDFRINTVVPASAGEPQLELRADGYSGITAWPSGTAVNLEANGGGALGTPPCQLTWDANCNWLFEGDSNVTIPTGALGTAPNQIVWNAAGQVTLTGTASLPPAASISDIGNVTITNPQDGQSLIYNSTTQQWVNSTPVTALAGLSDVALTAPANGQALIYNAATQKWVNLPPVTQLVNLSDVHITGPVAGQVLTYSIAPFPGWVNATIPGFNFLTNLSISNPQTGQVLTWDGSGWVAASPGSVAQFPLTSLTDVNIQNPINRQVLTWDAPNSVWINASPPMPALATLPDVSLASQQQGQILSWDATLNRWVNTSLPGGEVIALNTLMDTNISNAQNNQVLTWNYAQSRWVNQTLPISPIISNPLNGQILTYNGTNWVNAPPAFSPVLSNPAANQVLTFTGVNWVNAPLPAQALANLSDVALASPQNDQLLTFDAATSRWKNGGSAVIVNDGATALTVTATDANWATEMHAPNYGLHVQAGATNTDYCALFQDATGSHAYLQIFGDGSGTLGAGAASSMSWNAVGAFQIRRSLGITSANGTKVFQSLEGEGSIVQITGIPESQTFNVMAGVNTVPNVFAAYITDQTSNTGCSNGLRVIAGTNTSDRCASFSLANATEVFRIAGDGGGFLGPSTSPIYFSPSGMVSLGSNNGGPRLWVQGALNGHCFWINSANNTAQGIWPQRLINSGSAAGCSNGLYIQAGTNASDYPLQVQNQSQGLSLLSVNGVGNMWMGGLRTGVANVGGYLTYTSGGEVGLSSSSRRFKSDIHTLARKRIREIVSKLRVVSFRPANEEDGDTVHYGLIAEEVEAVDASLVTHDYRDGTLLGVRYDEVAMLLLPLVQELLGVDEPEEVVYG